MDILKNPFMVLDKKKQKNKSKLSATATNFVNSMSKINPS